MLDEKHSDTPVDSCRKPTVGRRVIWTALAFVCACSPTFDWRSVPLPDTPLVTELPCRPARFQRDVSVAGVPLRLFMLSCEAGGVTYGVATAEVSDPAKVDPVLFALRDSAAGAIRSADSTAGALNLGGITPFPGNTSAHLHGRRPDGATIEEAVRVFARGTRVYQASAVGARLPDAALRPFEEGLRFELEKPAAGPS